MRYTIILISMLFLSSCGLFPKNIEERACPEIGFIANSDHIQVADVEVSMAGFSGSCRLKKDGLHVTLIIPFKAKRVYVKGDPDYSDISRVELPYFIAILKPDEKILKKTVFSTEFDFNNLKENLGNEEHNIVLPLASFKEAYNYKITMGFILTEEQLRQNRNKK